jgi:hypothetical protein
MRRKLITTASIRSAAMLGSLKTKFTKRAQDTQERIEWKGGGPVRNMVVAHSRDGSLLKGTTSDFFPTKETFHVVDKGTGKTKEVRVSELKAVFFVKTYDGNKDRGSRRKIERKGLGRKIMVNFKDGEIILGYATSYSSEAVGFFVFPSDPDDNNDRIFVVNAATNEVRFLVNV